MSLAVWMSGVTREIDRLRRHDGAYGDLLDLLHVTARVDVIAGASAGGLAGTLLGLAVATESDVSSAADLWVERGGFKDMLRDPFEPDPPSLLRGDDYFLAQVRDAFGTIAAGAGNHPSAGGAADAQNHDIHLIVTTTTLSGEQAGYPDHFGAVIRDVDHRQAFHFMRTRVPERDDFGTDDRSLSRLALAARTSSSFPGAFEPSLIPVGADGADDLHPDMNGIATFEHRRWAVDGGVLVNTPFRRALEAIKLLPAEREVRRVLVYIVASSGSAVAGKHDSADEMPSLRDVVLDALSDLPRVQSFRDELEEIAEINRRASERRRARRELLLGLGSNGLAATAERLMPAYVAARAEAAVADVTRLVAEEAGRQTPLETAAPALDVRTLRAAVPVPDPRARAAGWKWGIAPVEYGANVVLDLLREALLDQQASRPTLQKLRGRLHQQLARLRELQAANEEFWRSRAEELTNEGAERYAAEWRTAHAEEAGTIARELGRIAAAAARAIPGWDGGDGAVSDAAKLARALVPPDAQDPADAAVGTLLALHVVQRAAGSDLTGIEQAVELVQLSANVENSFDGRDRAATKLAGLQLHHFGAFYKRSWRANDWLWGRLDGATRLVQIVLDPRRLRTIAAEKSMDAAAIADRIVEIATANATDHERTYLLTRWKVGGLAQELAFLDDPNELVPARLPRCWGALATGIQFRVLHEELLGVAAAARADVTAKCLPTATGAVWAAELPPERALSPQETVAQFTKCAIGTEQLKDEFETDYFTGLASKASAVAGSVLRGSRSGLPKRARGIAAFLRGILVALYLLARGVTSGGRFGMFTVALALAIGGAFVALTLVANPPALVTSIGMILVLAGFGLAFLRGAGKWFALATALVIAAIVGAAVVAEWKHEWFDDLPNWLERLLPVVPIVVLAGLTMLLGVVHGRRPKAAVERGSQG